MPTSDLLTEFVQQRAKRRAATAREFHDSGAPIPDIDFMPPCPICDGDLFTDDGSYFECEVCMVRWPRNGYGHDAERINSDGDPIVEVPRG